MGIIIHKEGENGTYKARDGSYYTVGIVHELVGGGEVIISNPPSGKYKIVNIYWDDDLKKVVIEKEDIRVA